MDGWVERVPRTRNSINPAQANKTTDNSALISHRLLKQCRFLGKCCFCALFYYFPSTSSKFDTGRHGVCGLTASRGCRSHKQPGAAQQELLSTVASGRGILGDMCVVTGSPGKKHSWHLATMAHDSLGKHPRRFMVIIITIRDVVLKLLHPGILNW